MRIRPLLITLSTLFVAPPALADAGAPSSITEVTGFGSNPGNLKMFEHAPASLPANAPMVLVLHGCSNGGAQDVANVGWNELADANGFLVVYPEQQIANNAYKCFNWAGVFGDPSNLQRGKGENESIKEMVDKAIADHKSDPKRVYIVGFSAGGGTAAIMAATWPEVFAGVATMAGIPYDCTTTYSEVSTCIKPGKDKTPQEWGDLVRAAHAGPYPKFSIWQGAADSIVSPTNRTQMIRQWTNANGISDTPSATDTVDGQNHAVYKDASGKVLVESYEVAGMDHGVPVAPSKGCGAAAAYAIDKGICAAAHIAEFFDLSKPMSAGDAGAHDGGSTSSSSSSSSSTSSSSGAGGAPSDAGPTNGDAPTDNGTFGSTCAMSPSSSSPLAAIAALIAGMALVFRSKKKGSAR